MNKTEKRALDWLVDYYSFDRNSVIFQQNKSPDFILPDGMNMEVKRVIGKTLTITEAQFLSLCNCDNCFIAIFDDVCLMPKALIPVAGLEPPITWGEYTIKVSPDGLAKWRAHLAILRELKGKGLTREQFKTEYQNSKAKIS